MNDDDTTHRRAGALDGVRVVEMATMLSAPLTGMMLADHGADVIKIEQPGVGDQLRSWGRSRNGEPLLWKMLSRNKRLITLDLHDAEAQDVVLDLLTRSDVLIENFRPGTLDRWGLTSERLHRANPALVVLRVSGYGQTGPRSSRAGFGTLAEAFSGFAYINGWDDRPPSLPPFGLADAIAGMTGAFGITAALESARRTGQGQDIDIALYEPLLTALGSIVVDYDQLGIVQQRTGNRAPFSAPRNAYRTADDHWIAISGSTQSTASRLLTAIGRPELITDPRFATNQDRVTNVVELDDVIAAWIGERSQAEALSVFDAAHVTAGPVYSVDQLVEDEHVKARGSLMTVDDERLGPVRIQAPVPRMSGTPARIDHLGGALGADNDAVYAELGLTAAKLLKLRERGVI